MTGYAPVMGDSNADHTARLTRAIASLERVVRMLERSSDPASYPDAMEQARDLWLSIEVYGTLEEELGATVNQEREQATRNMEELRVRLVALGLDPIET